MADEPSKRSDWSEEDIAKLRSMIGGKRDIADGAIPAVIFVVANAIWSLTVASIASGAYGIGITLYRLIRRQDAKRALFGLVGLGIAIAIALRTGSASAYFVPGVILGLLFGVLTLLTVVMKQPTSAMFAMALEKKPAEYYKVPRVLRAHMLLTTIWAVVFIGRAALRAGLIVNDETALLGASAIVLGYPVTIGLAGLSVLYLRRIAATVEVSENEA